MICVFRFILNIYIELRSLRGLRKDDTWDKSDNLNVSQYISKAHTIMRPDLQNMRGILIFVRWVKYFCYFMLQTHFWQTTIIFLAQAHQIEKSDRFENWVVNSVKMSSFRTFETPGPGRRLGRGWVSYFMSGSSDILTRRRRPIWGGNTRSIETFSRTPLWTIIRISLVRSHGADHKQTFTYVFFTL